MTTAEFLGLPHVSPRGRRRPLRVALVCMPWASLDMPSMAISTLAPVARALDFVETADTFYANIRWADHVHEHTGGRIGSEDYRRIVDGYYVATGEWVFSPALYGFEEPLDSPFHAAATGSGADLTAAAEMYRLSSGFVGRLADELVAGGYDVVGMTSTFDQNMPSLALARALKERSLRVVTVMGGANCDDVQGAALHRNFACLDYVVRGEGELVLPRLLDLLSRSDPDGSPPAADLAAVPGLCWRDPDEKSAVNEQPRAVVPMDSVPEADLSGYFDTFRAARSVAGVEPKVQIEGGRGCWWGEKHHCTFCGLNGSLMAFRAKSSDRVVREIENAVRAHHMLDVVFADNIMDMGYLRDLLPRLAEKPWDLRLFFEIKSNLGIGQLKVLAEAGVAQVQPGIESLSTHVLRLMRKGVTGWQNVRLLRDCRTVAVFPGWNFLYGFPGETEADYEEVVEQLPGLWHLTPPEGVYRAVLTRFSPFFDDPGLGLENLGPSGLLKKVYKLPADEVADISYVFESRPAGISESVAERLRAAVDTWRANHQGRRLVAVPEGGALRIVDERTTSASEERLEDPLLVAVFLATLKGRSASGVTREVTAQGHRTTEERVTALLEEWRARRWLFHEDGRYVALPTGLGHE
ncbi:RiPP maturation radical SAM C-methyltransferase [Streptomyces abyssomicinicus]|uniref:RiPP maturation radical SAM C-methyltransferase n=1 Tax=Streptomyces abyssomicinicus TaxID=574929 RepID=UPI0012501EB3|nr:RiPP maturation radical SAM C-methyltransferase [Streptomyces abyssomicinicus]